MFNPDGTLTIGYVYPNMFMCEDYNSPQSAYWCMKTFCCLGLSDSHPFWTAAEMEIPAEMKTLAHTVKPAMQVLCDTGSHHFLLSSGQFCPWPLKATEAKYSKFVYSSHFGFSVPTGPLIQQMAPDSTLALQIRGDDSWKIRWIPLQPKFSSATLVYGSTRETLPVLVSSWRPWILLDVMVQTALIPPCSRWKDWHIRIHRVLPGDQDKYLQVDAIEGGFAVYGRKQSDGIPLSHYEQDTVLECHTGTVSEAIIVAGQSCLVTSSAGVSGIRSIRPISHSARPGSMEGHMLKPDSNTNLMCNRTVIPCLKGGIDFQGSRDMICLVTAVFATSKRKEDTVAMWRDVPRISLDDTSGSDTNSFIQFTAW